MTSWLNIWMGSKGPELNSQFIHSFLARNIWSGIFKDFDSPPWILLFPNVLYTKKWECVFQFAVKDYNKITIVFILSSIRSLDIYWFSLRISFAVACYQLEPLGGSVHSFFPPWVEVLEEECSYSILHLFGS